MSKDMNLPDNCQGSDPSFPWNEPEECSCPWCQSTVSMFGDELRCDNEECDYIESPDEYDGDY